MLDALNITEEDALGLVELAQHDLALARDFARRALAAAESEEASGLARSYQRAARSYRQSLALKVRLKRELAAAAQVQANPPRPRPGGAVVARRIGEVRDALLRLAWNEAERPEDERESAEWDESVAETFAFHRQGVEEAIAEDCLKDSFCDEPLDDHVARLALDVGFPPDAIAGWRDLADPPQAALDFEPEEDEPLWSSSA